MKRHRNNPGQRAVRFIAQHTDIGPDLSRPVIRSLVRFITQELCAGRRVVIDGIGTLYLKHRKGRISNAAGSVRDVLRVSPSADYVRFRVSPRLKKAVHAVRKPVYPVGQTPH